MWKRQALLTRILQLNSSKSYRVLGTELLKSGGGQLQKSIFPLIWTTTIISHNFSTQKKLPIKLFELGKDNEAFASLQKELSLNPQDKELHEILITKLKQRDRLKTDLESFYKAIADMIADPESVSNFYLTSADSLVKYKMFPLALLAYREAMKNNPPMNNELCFQYGEVLQHEGFYEEALVQFQQFQKCHSPNDDSLFWKYNRRVRTWAAYMNYCLGNIHIAQDEFEYLTGRKEIGTVFSKAHYFLVMVHLDKDEKVLNHYKEHELDAYMLASEGRDLIRFYEQELKITQKILQRGDLDEDMRKFNAKKLEALNVVFPFLRERIEGEIFRQQHSW